MISFNPCTSNQRSLVFFLTTTLKKPQHCAAVCDGHQFLSITINAYHCAPVQATHNWPPPRSPVFIYSVTFMNTLSRAKWQTNSTTQLLSKHTNHPTKGNNFHSTVQLVTHLHDNHLSLCWTTFLPIQKPPALFLSPEPRHRHSIRLAIHFTIDHLTGLQSPPTDSHSTARIAHRHS